MGKKREAKSAQFAVDLTLDSDEDGGAGTSMAGVTLGTSNGSGEASKKVKEERL